MITKLTYHYRRPTEAGFYLNSKKILNFDVCI